MQLQVRRELILTAGAVRAEACADALAALYAASLMPEPAVRSMWLGAAVAACRRAARAGRVLAAERALSPPRARAPGGGGERPGVVLARAA